MQMLDIFVYALSATILLPATRSTAQEPSGTTAADWTRGAVCYEIFVRSFADSDGDGVGDLRGLTQRLDYINDGNPHTQRDLGARCIWLMPVAQSPSYHGYDVIDYYRIERDYGTDDDFKLLVFEAHKRGIRVLVDLVLNHASSEHPYFKDALLNPDSPYRERFLWSPTDPGIRGPWGQQVWHLSDVREEYYYGVFWGGMPDLNYDSPAVREEAKRIATFWLDELGADGFRLDAVKHLAEEDYGRIAEHVPATHDFLRELARHVQRTKPGTFTIGEVWDSIGAMLLYYPDQLDGYFAFEASEAIIESVRAGSATRLLDPFLRLQRELPAHRWSPFLRNHDQTRTVTALGGDIARARVAATLLLTLPGLPFVYYGEEIGMSGDKPDPRLRTPMHWRRQPGVGFTDGLAWEPLHPDSFTANVEVQDDDSTSLLNLYRRLIHLRDAHPALATGELIPLRATHDAVAAYLRRDNDRAVLVIANLGMTALANVGVSTESRAVAAGQYDVRNLFDGSRGRSLRVTRDGRIDGYVPALSLLPLEVLVLDLVPGR